MMTKFIYSWLRDEIQGSELARESMIQTLESLRNGDLSEWEESGNAHTIEFRDGTMFIQNNYSQNISGAVSIEELITYLKAWDYVKEENQVRQVLFSINAAPRLS